MRDFWRAGMLGEFTHLAYPAMPNESLSAHHVPNATADWLDVWQAALSTTTMRVAQICLESSRIRLWSSIARVSDTRSFAFDFAFGAQSAAAAAKSSSGSFRRG
jgi:hypothetical protein